MNSLRYIKKVAGDTDELAANAERLGVVKNETESNGVEIDDHEPPKNGFSSIPFEELLSSDDDIDEEKDASSTAAGNNKSNNGAQSSKNNKKKSSKTNKQKEKRKQKAETSRHVDVPALRRLNDMNEDELLDFYAKQNNIVAVSGVEILDVSEADFLARYPLTRVDAHYLSGDEELREIMPTFDAPGDGNAGGGSARAAAGLQHKKMRLSFKFIRPDTTANSYPPLAGVGLTMTLLERTDKKSNEKWFVFRRNEKYRQTQAEFLERQVNMDIEGLFHLYMQSPYNIDNLITIAEFHRMQEEPETGRHKLQTGLYALESTCHHKFSYTDGLCRMDYRVPANRSYFLTVFDYMLHMSRKNCYKTALECCKLLLSLNAYDPLALLMLIDYYALMSESFDTLLQFYARFEREKRLDMMPNFLYSLALAYYLKAKVMREIEADKLTRKSSKKIANSEPDPQLEANIQQLQEKASACLERAIIRFPYVAMKMLEKSEFPVSSFVKQHEFLKYDGSKADAPALYYLCVLTAVRASKLWTEDAATVSWLLASLESVLYKYDNLKQQPRTSSSNAAGVEEKVSGLEEFMRPRVESDKMYSDLQVPVNLYRHVFLCGLVNVSELQLPSFTQVLSIGIARFDPIPPKDTTNADECDLMAVIRKQAQRSLDERRRQAANEPARRGGDRGGGVTGEINRIIDYLQHLLPGSGNDDLSEHEMNALLQNLREQQEEAAVVANGRRRNANNNNANVAAAAAPQAAAPRAAVPAAPAAAATANNNNVTAVRAAAESTAEGLYGAGRALRDAMSNLFAQINTSSIASSVGDDAASTSSSAADAAVASSSSSTAAAQPTVSGNEKSASSLNNPESDRNDADRQAD